MPPLYRPHRLASALALALAAGSVSAADTRGLWIVRFAEPALASYAGQPLPGGEVFAATSPRATGADRLDPAAPASVAYLAELAERREQRLAQASALLGREIEPVFVYDAVLNGVALELDAAEAARISRVPGIVAVEREHVDAVQDEVATAWTNAPQLWSGAAGVVSRGEGVVVGVIDTGINPTHPSFAAQSPTDGYVHPNLRGGFLGLCATGQAACNNKLIGIWDFTTGSSDGEPNNGLDQGGHGTHVAGIAVGNPVAMQRSIAGAPPLAYQIRGVAPRAHLVSYKACEGADVGCPGSWTLAALNQAVIDRVDVINYSIGGQNNNPWGRSDSLAMLDARNAGIVVAVAAGNRGPDVSTVTSPADSPWVMGVANSRHGRRFVNRLRLSGGATSPPNGGVLVGDALTGGVGPAPIVRDPAAPLCSQGSGDTALPPTGASNPWPAGRWNGQVLVCDRGVQARVAKSNNVRLAGGGGMVLVNTAAEGEGTVADEHSVPSTHVGFAAGQALLQWLSLGTGHTARLDGTSIEVDAATADVLNTSSGRGPSIVVPAVIKPDLAAPGTDILSADNDSNGDASLTGTSMASPHVAGAAALLRSARPAWQADQIISALMTTARPSVRREDGVAMGAPSDQGAGMIDLSRAVRAGLSLNVPAGQFQGGGGNPALINLPSLVFADCTPDCGSLSRTVTDLVGGGAWTVEVEAPAGVVMTPSTTGFTLAAGAFRVVTLSARIENPGLWGRWIGAALVFRRAGGDGVSDARLPVLLRASAAGAPGAQSRSVSSDRGWFDTVLPGLTLPLPNARFAGTVLVAPTTNRYTLSADPTPSSRYDNLSNGVGWHTLTVPAPSTGLPTRYRIEVDLQVPGGTATSLIVGNGSSPGSRNQLCESASRCVLDVEHPGTGGPRVYWAMVWNRSGSGNFTVTQTVLPLAPAPDSSTARLTVTGPGSALAVEDSTLRVGWSDPAWPSGEVRRGAVLAWAGPGDQPLVAMPWTFTRTDPQPAPRALASGDDLALTLPAGAAQERVFIDVPPGTTRLQVQQSGSADVALFLARVASPSPSSAIPAIAAAPARGAAVASDAGSTTTKTLVVDNPAAGRWYLTSVNNASQTAPVSLRATLTGNGPVLRPGSYFNPQRSGAGLMLHPAAGAWVGLWYTYLQDGTPTWYYLEAAAPPAHGQWRSPIYRAAWNGSAASLTRVGEAVLTPQTVDSATFTYAIDGETGSEAFESLGRGCPTIGGSSADTAQHWFDPARAGSGYSAQLFAPPSVGANYEFYAAFLYDARGQPRFVVAEGAPVGASDGVFPLDQLTGWCPLCTRPSGGATRTPVGTLTRTLVGGRLSRISVDATYTGPVTGRWNVTDTVEPLDAQRRMQGCAP